MFILLLLLLFICILVYFYIAETSAAWKKNIYIVEKAPECWRTTEGIELKNNINDLKLRFHFLIQNVLM